MTLGKRVGNAIIIFIVLVIICAILAGVDDIFGTCLMGCD